MKEKKKENTIKHAVTEVISSTIIIIIDLIYLIFLIYNYQNYTAKLYKYIGLPLFVLFAALCGLLYGLISIPLILKKRRKD